MKQKRRILSLLIASCLVLSAMPQAVFAETGTGKTEVNAGEADRWGGGNAPLEGADLSLRNGDAENTTMSDADTGTHQHPVCGIAENCTNPNHETGHGNVTWKPWNEEASMPTIAGNYYLTGDVSLSSTWEVPGGTTNLCLNGHSIIFTEGLEDWNMDGKEVDSTSRSVIKVSEQSILAIADCQNNTGKITGGTGTFVPGLYSGIGGGYCGGGLFVEGELNLYGGNVEGNHCPLYADESKDQGGGGGIFVNGGTFYMYGGSITQNSACENGNGVFCLDGEFHMSGGSITQNGREIEGWRLTYMGSVGGIVVRRATMTMSGGEISDNLAYYIGGIKAEGEGSSLTISGEAKIKNHTCSKIDFGGVYVLSGTEFFMNNGEISNNIKGAVTVQDAVMTMKDGVINANNDGSTYGMMLTEMDDSTVIDISGGTVSCKQGANTADIVNEGEHEGSALKLSGSPTIGTISLSPEGVITIADTLLYSTPIVVEKQGGGVITAGWTEKMQDYSPEDYFACWNPAYTLELSDQELCFTAAETAHIHDAIQFDRDLGIDVKGHYESYPGILENEDFRLTADLVFGEENNFGNTLFIGDDESQIEVNFCLNNYELSRLDAGDSGPVLVVNPNATLNLYSCGNGKITGNTSDWGIFGEVGLGGGILVMAGSTLNMYGGSITDNSATNAGGGIYVEDGAIINLCNKDKPVIIDGNTVGEAKNNLYLDGNAILNIKAPPAEGSKIGISQSTPGLFATVEEGISAEDVAKFFTSDDPGYSVVATERGLELAEKYPTPTITIDYAKGILTGFEKDANYIINGTSVTVGENQTLAIAEEWFGESISIVRTGDDMEDSEAQSLTIPAQPERPASLDIDYSSVKITGTTTAMEYSVDLGKTWISCTEDMSLESIGWKGEAKTVVFRTKATESSFAGDTVSIELPARPDAPLAQAVAETVSGRKDGKITGLTAGIIYEISSDSGQTWTDATLTGTEITGLAPGTYEVRSKASEDSFASEGVQIKIDNGAAPTYTLNVTVPVFDTVYTGYKQPEAKEIIITSTGNSDTKISDITVDSEHFIISGSGYDVPAGGTIETWTVRPADKLGVGTYTGNIKVSYTGAAEATAKVEFTVKRKSSGGTPTYYALNFETNGGSSIPTLSTTYGKTIDLSDYVPTREGYDFNGWYADKELTEKIEEIQMNGSKTVYAGWTEHKAEPIIPGKVKIIQAFTHKNGVRVIGTCINADGYEFSIRKGGDGQKYGKIYDVKECKYTFKELKENTRYVIRIRPYHLTDGVRIYGEKYFLVGRVLMKKADFTERPTVAKVTNAFTHKKGIRVDVKSSGAHGYEFYIRKGGENQEYTLVQDSKKAYCKMLELTEGQRYVIRIKPYAIVDEEKVYAIENTYVTGRAEKAKKSLM